MYSFKNMRRMEFAVIFSKVIIISSLSLLTFASPQSISPFAVRVNKCCEKFEVIQDGRCTDAKVADENGTETWEPIFTSESGEMNVNVQDFKFVIGLPDCGGMQMWPVYQYPSVRMVFYPFRNGILMTFLSIEC